MLSVFSRVFASALLISSLASAQDEPAGLMKHDPASTGSTDVASEGFQAAEKAAAEAKDATEASVQAGALLAAGNARSLSATASGTFRARRSDHQFGAAASANYAQSAADPESNIEPTMENYQGKVRYDYFLVEGLAVFMALSARHDRFQGLDLRLNFDPGVAYYFVDEAKHQLWGELGYDLQHDVRSRRAIAIALAEGTAVEKTETRHNLRVFVGYDNKLNEAVTFLTGVEYLQGLSPLEDEATGDMNWRLNWDAGISAAVASRFSMATTLSVRYDNNPLPGVRNTDIMTALNLVYTLL
jgi:putative salt-induced outer membrane protein